MLKKLPGLVVGEPSVLDGVSADGSNQMLKGPGEKLVVFSSAPQPVPFQYLLFCKAEMARYLGVEVRTLENWMARRLVPFIKIGGTVRFRVNDVLCHLQTHHQVHPRLRSHNSRPAMSQEPPVLRGQS
jgi:excisionase family DNA binding protein